MAVEFRCEKCGRVLNVAAAGGGVVRCAGCGRNIHVPSASSRAAMGVMARAMPWVISAFFHAGLFLIMVFVVMIQGGRKPPPDVFFPYAEWSDNPSERFGPSQDEPNIKSRQNPSRQERIRKEAVLDAGRISKQPTLIGMGGGASAGLNSANRGWGTRGPGAAFMGGRGNAYHVVYVIDRSGSMVVTFNYLRHRMLESIARLREKQDFHIIMFSDGKPIENMPRKLVPASARCKIQAAKFLADVVAMGQSDPVPALERAFEVLKDAKRTKLIHFLTDAEFSDNAKILAVIKKYNGNRQVSINTFLYGSCPPEAEKVMRKIAAENNGHYLYVSLDDMD